VLASVGKLEVAPAARAPGAVDRDVARDPREPGGERRLALPREAVYRLEGENEGLLDHLVDLEPPRVPPPPWARLPFDRRAHLDLVLPHDLVEGLTAPLSGLRD
jgi:hypothetical protein